MNFEQWVKCVRSVMGDKRAYTERDTDDGHVFTFSTLGLGAVQKDRIRRKHNDIVDRLWHDAALVGDTPTARLSVDYSHPQITVRAYTCAHCGYARSRHVGPARQCLFAPTHFAELSLVSELT